MLETIADPLAVTFIIPLVTLNSVLAKSPSISVALTPVIAVKVSSTIVCKPGTVFIGASFTFVTFINTVSVSFSPSLSVDKTVNVSWPT